MELKPLVSNIDERGTLVEAFRLPSDGQVFYVVANPKETRGNHYHERKTERFLVVFGSATITVRDRLDGTVMNVEVSGSNPMTVTIAPNNTHAITASDEGCIFLVWVDEQFNEDDPDTFGEEI